MTAKKYSGYLFRINEPGRADFIEDPFGDSIDDSKTFSDTISAPDWKAKAIEIFLISLNPAWQEESIDYIALVKRRNKVATLKYKIEFTDIQKLNPSIPLKNIEDQLSKRFRDAFIESSKGEGKRVPPKTWENIISIIKNSSEDNEKILTHFESLRELKPKISTLQNFVPVAEEKDAVNLALRMSNFNKNYVKRFKLSEETPIPFLNGLKDFRIPEDQMINNDSRIFGDWNIFKEHITGAVQFNDRQSYDRNSIQEKCLTIWNVNRTKIEQSLGVDLIYFNHFYNSYTMVQYKRMTKENGTYCYRPIDKSYNREVNNMKSLYSLLKNHNDNTNGLELNDYRFSQEFLFFKLCEEIHFEFNSSKMIEGMYIPLNYWDLLLKSNKIIGSRGGKVLTNYNVGGFLNNTFFTNLVSSGWIGSQSIDSQIISEIINQSLAENRSIILADYESNIITHSNLEV